MKIRIETLALGTVVLPEGRLDFGAAPAFQVHIEQLIVAGSAQLLIDCVGLEYVSSAGLRVFLRAARAAQRAGIAFGLCALQPAVREVFQLSGFDRIITVHAGRPAPLAREPQDPV